MEFQIPMQTPTRARRACALPALALSFAALPGLAQDELGKAFNPYAADVRKALAPPPGETPRPGLDATAGDGESAACRELRMKVERARNAPPPPQYDVYPEAPLRDGRRDALRQPNPIPGGIGAPTSRDTFLKPGGGNDNGELARLEGRYFNECRR